MMPRHLTNVLSMAAVGAAGFALAAIVLPRESGAADKKPTRIKSAVVTWDEAPAQGAAWGEIRFHYRGETPGTKNVLAAVAVLKPGQAIHGAHRHVEEEYQMVTEGSGTWHHDGKEFPAKKGDIQYIEPWVYHGLTNTGDKPLTFVVFKYSSKGVKLPPHPNDGKKDEL